MNEFLRKLAWLWRRRDKEADLRDELEFHLSEEAEDRISDGTSAAEARQAARRALGNVALVQEDTRASWTWAPLEQVLQDVRYAWRSMAANKSFSLLAILSLALGMGANTAIFSFMDSILLRSLPVRDPQSLVTLSWHTPARGMHGSNRHDNSYDDPSGGFVGGFFSYPAYELLRGGTAVFSTVFGYQGAGTFNLTYRGQAMLARTEYVTGNYFQSLAVPPAAGRLLDPDDDRAGAASVVIVSHELSQRRFGGPANATGQTVLINNYPFTVVGVAPPEFFGVDPDMPPDLYVPLHSNLVFDGADKRFPPARTYNDPQYDWVILMARLRPGVTREQALATAAPQFAQYQEKINPRIRPEDRPRLMVREAAGGLDSLRRRFSKPLYILFSLVGLILAIACANIANLMLARAAARRREMAVRLSIGAGRRRVIRQLLTESVVLSSLGGALGLLFAIWGIRALTVLLANGRTDFTLHAELNWRVLAIAGGLAVLTGILFGLAPALNATRVDLMAALKESRTNERRANGFLRLGLGRALIVSQVAITTLILVAAGLFLRTLSNLQSIPLGFPAENLLTFSLNARQAGHKDPEIVTLYHDLRAQFAAIPGARSATLSNHLLLGDGTSGSPATTMDGRQYGTRTMTIGPAFFETMGIPVLLGRATDERDHAGAPLTAVVNQAFAKRFFDGQSAVGQHLMAPRACPTCVLEIVGVVGDTLYGALKESVEPTLFLPFDQKAWGDVSGMNFELRVSGNPMNYARTVREIVRRADDRIPVSDLATQTQRIDRTINQEITFARLCTSFAALALIIACVGLYGSMSYNVARRTGEIGIRMALGAPRRRLLWMVLRDVLLLCAMGLAIGIPCALAASKLVKTFLFGTTPEDPWALAGAGIVLLGAATLAGYLPARYASRMDPVAALRHE